MTLLHEVAERQLPISRLEPVIGHERYERLASAATRLRSGMGERTIWNVNSTAVGGGVAEMLQVIVGYVAGTGISIRWITVGGDPAFFGITKRLHNQLHGAAGTEPVSSADARHYEQVLAANADELLAQVRPGDVVILHDPQTAGLTRALADSGAKVLWRCHIGIDEQTDISRAAWEFLRPYLAAAQGYVFTRRQFAPLWVPRARVWVIPPSIDPFAPKNAELAPATVRRILDTIGLPDGAADEARPGPTVASLAAPPASGQFQRGDGTWGDVTREAMITAEGMPGPDDPVVVQVSRWDRLKDMAGVMTGFAEHGPADRGAYLLLVGPAMSGVTDDPEGAQVYAECLARWHELPAATRQRVLLVTLPLDDVDENAAMVNAIQRRANVIVQKSLAEGFGLTVAEGMWKGRPVVGSAVGGIVDQIAEGTGVLLPDPSDLAVFGDKVSWLLEHRAEAERLGRAGRAYTREHFIGDVHLLRFAEAVESVIT
ncbi:MAG TPA: glycosyltransferase [Streptosporangiaceae bacterium]